MGCKIVTTRYMVGDGCRPIYKGDTGRFCLKSGEVFDAICTGVGDNYISLCGADAMSRRYNVSDIYSYTVTCINH